MLGFVRLPSGSSPPCLFSLFSCGLPQAQALALAACFLTTRRCFLTPPPPISEVSCPQVVWLVVTGSSSLAPRLSALREKEQANGAHHTLHVLVIVVLLWSCFCEKNTANVFIMWCLAAFGSHSQRVSGELLVPLFVVDSLGTTLIHRAVRLFLILVSKSWLQLRSLLLSVLLASCFFSFFLCVWPNTTRGPSTSSEEGRPVGARVRVGDIALLGRQDSDPCLFALRTRSSICHRGNTHAFDRAIVTSYDIVLHPGNPQKVSDSCLELT